MRVIGVGGCVVDIVSRPSAIEFEDELFVRIVRTRLRMASRPPLSAAPLTTGDGRALFLDRDGTVIVHIPYLHRPEGVAVIPGVPEALARARGAGFRLYLFTNQSGVGRGLFGLEDVHAVNRRMIELLGLGPAVFDGICIAPEAPDAPSRYRKPSPRYIVETCASAGLDPRRCWMMGDSPADWEAGVAAGIRSVAVGVGAEEPPEWTAKRTTLGVRGFADLPAAIAHILG